MFQDVSVTRGAAAVTTTGRVITLVEVSMTRGSTEVDRIVRWRVWVAVAVARVSMFLVMMGVGRFRHKQAVLISVFRMPLK